MNAVNAILEFLKKIIWTFVDKFKMKNPVVFGIVASLLLGIFQSLTNLINQGLIADIVLFTLPIVGKVTLTTAIVCVLTLLGAHTPSQPAPEGKPSEPAGEIDEA